MSAVDLNLVFCVEATSRTQAYSQDFVDYVTSAARIIVEDLKRDILTAESNIKFFLILFRNCKCDGEKSLELRGPFHFPEEESHFQEALQGIEYIGGGRNVDPRCSGLEAIWCAMNILQNYKQDSLEFQHRIREGIIVLAKSKTSPIGNNMENSCPIKTPCSFDILANSWNDEIQNKSVGDNGYWKMILVTPDESSWHRISEEWYNVYREKFFDDRGGLFEYDFKFLADMIGARS